MKSVIKTGSRRTQTAAPAQCQGAHPVGWGELYQILNKLLERRQYLMPFIKEFNCIDGALCKYFEGMPVVIIGKYKVEGRLKNNEWQINVLEEIK